MSDSYRIDSHKLIYHPKIVGEILDAEGDWEKAKKIAPIYAEISPVGACNHRCTFCAVDYIGYQSRTLDFDVFSARIKEMGGMGLKSVMFAGEGEPLLHKKIVEMCEYTHMAGIDIAFTSNATVIPKGFNERVLPITSWFKASVNAGTEDSYSIIHQTKSSDFNRVIENLSSMIEYRNSHNLSSVIGAQILLLPENSHEITTLARICKERIGLDYLVVKPYSQHLFSHTTKYNGLSYDGLLELEEKLNFFNSDTFQVIFRSETMKKYSELEESRYKKCSATPHLWMYVMADGSLYSCSAFLLDDRFKLGNIMTQSFKEIWQGEKRKQNMSFVENTLDIGECRRNCRMDAANRYLSELKSNSVPHVNFI